ncbi:MAG: glycosyltransferase [Saprospiraceae bacterium]|nr:glycosyltransferase [Saprospiraceae bacterium]MCB9321316.1 glycosyltransferase [Lewinellaceae bacterium]
MEVPVLSIVIVNYNVRYFLEQCLNSVIAASQNLTTEIIVVDNASSDDSMAMVHARFPQVQCIANTENAGFARANNQGIMASTGDLVLLLNPDTVLQENTLYNCVEFLRSHPSAGAVGVRMIDGSGKFLPESKRGLPTPFVAFCRFSGLASLFPRSKLFNRYYLGYLDEHKDQEVDVLCGAFMMVRREAINKAGLLDERFFMYGEDIDWSYRITQAGFSLHYLASTSIIHYKGESMRKGSLKYIRIFYQAMVIFANKYFGRQARWYVWLLRLGIYSQAGWAFITPYLRIIGRVLVDAFLLMAGFYLLKEGWESIKYSDTYYPASYNYIQVPAYAALFILYHALLGGYRRIVEIWKWLHGWFWAVISLLIIYALLPDTWRPSRVLLLASSAWALLYWLIKWMAVKGMRLHPLPLRRILIIGSKQTSQRLLDLLEYLKQPFQWVGYIDPEDPDPDAENFRDLSVLPDLCRSRHVDEIIFSSPEISVSAITQWMTILGPDIHYKMANETALSIIGSSSKDTRGELITYDLQQNLQIPHFLVQKRLLDLGVALLLLVVSPVVVWNVKNKRGLAANWWQVIRGYKTWVGYAKGDPLIRHLPPLRQGILSPTFKYAERATQPDTLHKINSLYAKEFDIWMDIEIIFRGFQNLGND